MEFSHLSLTTRRSILCNNTSNNTRLIKGNILTITFWLELGRKTRGFVSKKNTSFRSFCRRKNTSFKSFCVKRYGMNNFDASCLLLNNKKSPRGIGPRRFPPLGVQIHYGHSRYVPKWYKVLKLVIFLTFDVCAAVPSPQRLLCTLLLVISWIPYGMNTFPFPHSLVIHLF